LRIAGHIIDIALKEIYPGEIEIGDGVIRSVQLKTNVPDQYILPGFIDAHVHIESSMLVPSEFARMAVVHGTVATVSDPHEIANVLGVEGVEYMIANGSKVPFKFFFGAPSCVPATGFETAGASIGPMGVGYLLEKPEVKYLAEMMNWPGVLHGDPDVFAKIAAAKKMNKVVDGHAPGLKGEEAKKYASAGITTDHECFTEEEARTKLQCGMKIIIREGSAAKNFDALVGLLHDHSDHMMFCSDDKHPDSLEEGHINVLVKRAIEAGVDPFKVLKAACINPIDHYNLDVGKLRVGDPADFIVVKDLIDFSVLNTFIRGQLVAENGQTLIGRVKNDIVNKFRKRHLAIGDLDVKATSSRIRVIEAKDSQLITGEILADARIANGNVVSDIHSDTLKIAVINRYEYAPPAVGFIRNFGFKSGAIASSVAHDSHNVIVVGADDGSMIRAANLVMGSEGGVAAVDGKNEMMLALPVGGLMSVEDGYEVSKKYKMIDRMAKEMGSGLSAPFMTLSFMALLVIPSLKLSDKGLFNGSLFEFSNLFVGDH